MTDSRNEKSSNDSNNPFPSVISFSFLVRSQLFAFIFVFLCFLALAAGAFLMSPAAEFVPARSAALAMLNAGQLWQKTSFRQHAQLIGNAALWIVAFCGAKSVVCCSCQTSLN